MAGSLTLSSEHYVTKADALSALSPAVVSADVEVLRDHRVTLAARRSSVSRGVLADIDYLEVLGAVVLLVAVPMVDVLARPEPTAEHVLSDVAVLVDSAVVRFGVTLAPEQPVSAGMNRDLGTACHFGLTNLRHPVQTHRSIFGR